KLLGREVDQFANLDADDDDALLSAVATRFYFGRGEHGTADLPGTVLFPWEFEDRSVVEELLDEAADRRVRTHVPQRGEK
ncbi:MAG: hypothetical protein GWN71_29865, partial [Gammaproteobacteria bacterium]|nr:hypothetical protein [Gemmatimonadota bacterium]NIU77608.1 hypothetical protein [Gammaproteobacteria bacterium]